MGGGVCQGRISVRTPLCHETREIGTCARRVACKERNGTMSKRNVMMVGNTLVAVASAVLIVLFLTAAAAQAQGPGRPPRLTPEQSKAAWAIEAKHVAGKLELSEEATGKLVKAYSDAQTAYAESMNKKREELQAQGGDREGMRGAFRKAMEEVRTAEREKFSAALAAFLNEEQTKKVVSQLGGFNGSLDNMVNILAGFKLEDKQAKALDLVLAYTLEQTKLWTQATGEQQDFAALREKMTALKTKLDTDLGEILSNEQLAKWKEATAPRGRGGFGGGGQGARREDSGAGAGGESAPPSSTK